MRIAVNAPGEELEDVDGQYVELRPSYWNDWWKYRTLFDVSIVNDGEVTHIGAVKIGQIDFDYEQTLSASGTATKLPDFTFEQLSANFVSLGQDETYYLNLKKALGKRGAKAFLRSINDLALDMDRFDEVRLKPVVSGSLLRSVTARDVRSVYNRLINGKASRASFDFKFLSWWDSADNLTAPVELRFRVGLESNPPTNVHAIIGRNGSGKTTLLQSLANTVLEPDGYVSGSFVDENNETLLPDISNLVYVAFSAFDEIALPVLDSTTRYSIPYTFVGLQEVEEKEKSKSLLESYQEDIEGKRQTRRPDQLATDFARSALRIMHEKSPEAWRRALGTLESDPLFAAASVASLIDDFAADAAVSSNAFTRRAIKIYNALSSGHKVVLLTLTRLVEACTEQTLVILDEPESHLHPPLLSAFIRALAELMSDRNSLAVIATHSPVVLQEVPRECVLKVVRSGTSQRAARLTLETFGENVGTLTATVFGLEVEESGFNKLILKAAEDSEDYDAVVARFDSPLGTEARALVRATLALRGTPE